MSKMHLKQKLLGVLALAAMFGATEASAQANTQNLTVQATVPTVCVVDASTATALDFGTLDLAAAPATFDNSAVLAWRCSLNTPVTIELSAGQSNDFNARVMDDGNGNQLPYNLYTDGTFGTIWDDGTGGAGFGTVGGTGAGMGAGNVQTTTVNGRIVGTAAADLPPGVYDDTILVTLQF